jgi:hypothetical protein
MLAHGSAPTQELDVGQHTREVLLENGFTEDEVARLLAIGAVRMSVSSKL